MEVTRRGVSDRIFEIRRAAKHPSRPLFRPRDWLCRSARAMRPDARNRMRMECARIRVRGQCRVSPRPCYTTYHHPGPEPIPVLSLSLFLFSFTTDRPTDLNPIDPSTGTTTWRTCSIATLSSQKSINQCFTIVVVVVVVFYTFEPSTSWINHHWQV